MPRRLQAVGLGMVLAFVAGMATACEPTCRQTCRKLVSCEIESDRVTLEECEASCVFQERELEDTEQDGLRDQLADQKRCINRETCDDVVAGVCLDPDLTPF